MCLISGHSILLICPLFLGSVLKKCFLLCSYTFKQFLSFSIFPIAIQTFQLQHMGSSGLMIQQKLTLPQVLQGQFDPKCDFGHVGHNMPLP